MVTTYQVRSHSKSCRKYKNEKYRYHFGKFFTEPTIISLPSPSDLPEAGKNNILNERTIKQYNSLDPRERNTLNPLKEDFEKTPSIKNILAQLGFTEDQYYNALSISSDSDFHIHSNEHQMHVLLITFS